MTFYLEEIIDITDFWYTGMVMICLTDNHLTDNQLRTKANVDSL